MAERKVKMKIHSMECVDDNVLYEKEFDVKKHQMESGKIGFPIFYIEIGKIPAGDRDQYIESVFNAIKKHPNWDERSVFATMCDGKPMIKIEFWEEED